MARLIMYIVLLGVVCSLTAAHFSATAVAADPFAACSVGSGGSICNSKGDDAQDMVRNIITVVLFLVGAISVIAIIYGGLMYTVSNGEPEKIKKAKSIIVNAIIGVVVALCASAIVVFVAGMLK